MLNLQSTFGGVDTVLSKLAQGYTLPESNIANFVAPVVDVSTRAGRVLRFGKEQFAIGDYRRAYGSNIPAVQSRFDTTPFNLNQEVLAWELPIETLEDATDGPAKVDLRIIETRNTMQRLMQSYEATVADAVSTLGIYEAPLGYANWTAFQAANAVQAGGGDWADANADPIKDINRLSRLVANQIGVRPNSLLLGEAVFDALVSSPRIRDNIKYTSADSINVDVLARYFNLSRGVRVAEGRKLDLTTGALSPIFPENAALLFYCPGNPDSGIMPTGSVTMSTPAFAYTYQLSGTPFATPEYAIKERRVIRAEFTIERSIELVGLGQTGLVGSAALVRDILA
jgi:hypothetical protein